MPAHAQDQPKAQMDLHTSWPAEAHTVGAEAHTTDAAAAMSSTPVPAMEEPVETTSVVSQPVIFRHFFYEIEMDPAIAMADAAAGAGDGPMLADATLLAFHFLKPAPELDASDAAVFASDDRLTTGWSTVQELPVLEVDEPTLTSLQERSSSSVFDKDLTSDRAGAALGSTDGEEAENLPVDQPTRGELSALTGEDERPGSAAAMAAHALPNASHTLGDMQERDAARLRSTLPSQKQRPHRHTGHKRASLQSWRQRASLQRYAATPSPTAEPCDTTVYDSNSENVRAPSSAAKAGGPIGAELLSRRSPRSTASASGSCSASAHGSEMTTGSKSASTSDSDSTSSSD